MNPYTVLAQSIGILGMIAQTASFAFKDVKRLYASQCLAAGLTIIHYLMIGGYSGMAMNMVAFSRCLCLRSKNPHIHGRLGMIAVLAFNVFLACFTVPAEGLIGLLPATTSFIATLSLWTRNNRIIHLIQLLIISPAWTTYSIAAQSIAGVANEIITVIVIFYYFIRFHRKPKAYPA